MKIYLVIRWLTNLQIKRFEDFQYSTMKVLTFKPSGNPKTSEMLSK